MVAHSKPDTHAQEEFDEWIELFKHDEYNSRHLAGALVEGPLRACFKDLGIVFDFPAPPLPPLHWATEQGAELEKFTRALASKHTERILNAFNQIQDKDEDAINSFGEFCGRLGIERDGEIARFADDLNRQAFAGNLSRLTGNRRTVLVNLTTSKRAQRVWDENAVLDNAGINFYLRMVKVFELETWLKFTSTRRAISTKGTTPRHIRKAFEGESASFGKGHRERVSRFAEWTQRAPMPAQNKAFDVKAMVNGVDAGFGTTDDGSEQRLHWVAEMIASSMTRKTGWNVDLSFGELMSVQPGGVTLPVIIENLAAGKYSQATSVLNDLVQAFNSFIELETTADVQQRAAINTRRYLINKTAWLPPLDFEILVECKKGDCDWRGPEVLFQPHVTNTHSSEVFCCLSDSCPPEFARHGSKEALHGHRTTYHSEKFACPKCGECFADNTRLHTHMMKHEEGQRLMCTEEGCDSRFRSQDALRRHMEVHSGSRYRCPLKSCGHVNKRENDRMTHARKKHKGLEPYFCTTEGCGKRFWKRHEWDKHLSGKVHTGDVNWKGIREEFKVIADPPIIPKAQTKRERRSFTERQKRGVEQHESKENAFPLTESETLAPIQPATLGIPKKRNSAVTNDEESEEMAPARKKLKTDPNEPPSATVLASMKSTPTKAKGNRSAPPGSSQQTPNRKFGIASSEHLVARFNRRSVSLSPWKSPKRSLRYQTVEVIDLEDSTPPTELSTDEEMTSPTVVAQRPRRL
ncbi:hypothetical protein PIIN_09253 [Serendipita indica DSM 11827]|uniref:C2H2-type domain-containing protein n=1 Tax=Serendipita indica (strain DSM 11827) TaxID=1109443 RepID=G4TVC6_SERID|nr:hypothetical protein PIIN_09253 [Serendipita indica DSM 11827]